MLQWTFRQLAIIEFVYVVMIILIFILCIDSKFLDSFKDLLMIPES